jgi:hypothetical protein
MDAAMTSRVDESTDDGDALAELGALRPPFRSQGTLSRLGRLLVLPVVLAIPGILLTTWSGHVWMLWTSFLGAGLAATLLGESPAWRRGLAPTSDERFSWFDFPHRRAAYERALATFGPGPGRWRTVSRTLYGVAIFAYFALQR